MAPDVGPKQLPFGRWKPKTTIGKVSNGRQTADFRQGPFALFDWTLPLSVKDDSTYITYLCIRFVLVIHNIILAYLMRTIEMYFHYRDRQWLRWRNVAFLPLGLSIGKYVRENYFDSQYIKFFKNAVEYCLQLVDNLIKSSGYKS